jgi:hypothetical protein
MAFDPRSRERLEALGRRLPEPLPPPPAAATPPSGRQLHAIETEDNPAQLFRELMHASPDGTVPDHLLQRLRDLERPPSRPQRNGRVQATSVAPEADDPYRMFQELLLEEPGEPPGAAAPPAQPTPGNRRRSRASR